MRTAGDLARAVRTLPTVPADLPLETLVQRFLRSDGEDLPGLDAVALEVVATGAMGDCSYRRSS